MKRFHPVPAGIERGRIRLLGGLAAALALPAGRVGAQGQGAYPTRPVNLVTPSSAGGATDIAARLVAQYLGRELGQPFVVDNRAGAAGMIAMQHLNRAEPDGYTLGIGSNSPLTTSPLLYKNPGYDPIASFAPIGLFTSSAHALLVAGDSPFKTAKDLVALGKAKPEALIYSSSGVNGSIHLLSVQFTESAGVQALHVPYKGGGDSATAIMSGRVTFAFDAISSVIGLIKAGKLRALAVSSSRRDALLPDVPTMAEAGFPEVTTEIFFGVIAPAKTPQPVIDKLVATVAKIAQDPAFRQDTIRSGSNPNYLGPKEFGQFLVAENKRWKSVIDRMGVVPQ